ncbi:spinster family MFS transporter [Aestuariibacter salexigens]|uniref:spinster family MFS transporter n=1 Tax=Aestuariibacter salexigens TaxID=226010 RepID=UPI00047CCC85|nr:MFS transporter [Aestuariibacter salexigens]
MPNESSSTPNSETVSATQSTTASNGYRTYVLLLLTLVYAFNFIDRQIIGILSPFIKADLGLDDAQLGYLKGIYFALLYTVCGLPIAWLADRYNRVNIVSVSLALWSGFTALSGLAQNYTQLALARIGVGIGEAGGSPPSHSIISDLYAKEERAGALAVYSLGIPFGIMAAFFASAFFLQGGSADWRMVMISVGLPGVVLALLLKFTVKEPQRTHTTSTVVQTSFKDSVKTLLSIPTWWGMCLGISFASFGNYAISTWSIDFYSRAHSDFDITTLLIVSGIINGTAYAAGVWLGGVWADKWGKRDKRGYALLPAMMLVIGAPAFFFSLHVENVWVSLGLLTVLLFTSGTYLGPCFAMAQTLAPLNIRAMSTALFFFVLNIIALGGGPTLVGILSQSLIESQGQTEALRTSLSFLIITYTMAILAFLWTSKKIINDWQKAEARGS